MDSDLVFTGDKPTSTITRLVQRGQLTRIAQGLYVDADRDPASVIRSEWHTVAGRLFPDATITDRSAPTGAPVDGVLYLARDGRDRELVLPGLTIRVRRGAPPQPGDVPLPDGLHLASPARGLAENCRESRARQGQPPRTLSEDELGDYVDRLCRDYGGERLGSFRREAESMAAVLGVPTHRLRRLKDQIGMALGTRETGTGSSALASRASGRPIDQIRMTRFETLVEALRSSAPQHHAAPDADRGRFEPFAEAYFSNFIEGTEFDMDEAARIVFDHEIPEHRPKDAHDVLGTYRLLSDRVEMGRLAGNADEFLELLRQRHHMIMAGRPEVGPGEFKRVANRAGATEFVDPELVPGTLAAGFRLRTQLDTAWERAVYIAFVIAEVHPFADGNGRIARAMMASELEAGGEARIIIPTVYRNDYLDGLRMLTRQDRAEVLIKVMRYAHDFTASIDFRDYVAMKAQLQEAHAFNEPESSDRLLVLGRRPVDSEPAPWRRQGGDTGPTRT